jgi:thioredoxin-like negative regulator of GroEL
MMNLSMRFRWPVCLVCLALFIVGMTSAAEPPYRLRIGDHVPDIEMRRLEGGQLRLSALNRQALAVSFYSPYCEPCQRELPILARTVARVTQETGADVKLVVVLADERPDVKLVAKLGPSVIWVMDDDQKVKAAFDPRTLPCTFVFGDNDVVRHINRGFGPQYEARVDDWLRKLVPKQSRQ